MTGIDRRYEIADRRRDDLIDPENDRPEAPTTTTLADGEPFRDSSQRGIECYWFAIADEHHHAMLHGVRLPEPETTEGTADAVEIDGTWTETDRGDATTTARRIASETIPSRAV